MKIVFKWIGITGITLALLAGIGWSAIGPDWRALISDVPQNNDLLFWSQSQREAAFKMMDKVPWMVKSSADQNQSPSVRELPDGEPLEFDTDMDEFFAKQQLGRCANSAQRRSSL